MDVTSVRHDHLKSVWIVACFIALAWGTGCTYEERVVKDGWAPLRALGDATPSPAATKSPAAPKPNRSSNKWAILIQSLEGPGHYTQAQRLIQRLATEAHLPDLWLQNRDNQTHIFRGLYADPNDPAARSDLRQTRMIKLADQRTFGSAELIPLGGGSQTATADPLDLRRHTGMYSLQIGYYDEDFGPDFRKAAEQAARALREQDKVEAYFYHGQHRSMVTIGLFTDDDFEQQGVQRVYGRHIKALQEKYPFNLGNGRTVIQTIGGQNAGEQSSFLVRVR